MMATPPPTPPSPPQGDGTPDAGNPAGAAPPEVAPKPGRQSERATKKPAVRSTKKPAARKTASKSTAKTATAKSPAAPRKPTAPRAPVARRPAARPRPRPAGLSVATAPTEQPVNVKATDPATRAGGRWWRTIAGGIGALAAGAALFSLRGSTRRKAHQADDTDSSKSFEAGVADEGTIPDEPTKP